MAESKSLGTGAKSVKPVPTICHHTPVNEENRANGAHVIEQVLATFPYLRKAALVLVRRNCPSVPLQRWNAHPVTYQSI